MTERRATGIVKIGWQIKETFPKRSLQQPVRHILLSLDGEFLLACTATKDYVFRTTGGAPVLVNDCGKILPGLDQSHKWATFSRKKHHIYEVHDGSQFITWDKDGSKLRLEDSPVAVSPHTDKNTERRRPYLVRLGSSLWAANDNNPHTMPILWPQATATTTLPAEAADKIAAQTMRDFDQIADQIDTLLGTYRGRIIFLSTEHWVCSVRIDKSKFDQVMAHFPMPHSWRRLNRPLKGLVTCKGDVVFAVDGDPVVVKNGL